MTHSTVPGPTANGHSYDDSRSPDTMYGPRPWSEKPRYSYLGPFSSNEERLVQQSLAAAQLPGYELQEVVRPPLPQIELFPPRYGYRTAAYGIDDIMGAQRSYPTRLSWFSGGPGSFQASSRDTLGNGIGAA